MPLCPPQPADPLVWTPERSDDLARRAATGSTPDPVRALPGGAVATAERVNRYRPLVEQAAKAAGANPDLLEALVFLESAAGPTRRRPAAPSPRPA